MKNASAVKKVTEKSRLGSFSSGHSCKHDCSLQPKCSAYITRGRATSSTAGPWGPKNSNSVSDIDDLGGRFADVNAGYYVDDVLRICQQQTATRWYGFAQWRRVQERLAVARHACSEGTPRAGEVMHLCISATRTTAGVACLATRATKRFGAHMSQFRRASDQLLEMRQNAKNASCDIM
jgi:hypothetical protein